MTTREHPTSVIEVDSSAVPDAAGDATAVIREKRPAPTGPVRLAALRWMQRTAVRLRAGRRTGATACLACAVAAAAAGGCDRGDPTQTAGASGAAAKGVAGGSAASTPAGASTGPGSAGGARASSGGPPPGPPVEVRTAAVERRTLPRLLEVTGTLFGTEEATISAQVAARVESVAKDVGDLVEPGDVLAQLDRTDYEMALELKRSAMLERLAALGLAELPGPEFDPATVPTVVKARLGAENAEARHRRAEQLWKQTPPLISEQDYSDLRTAWDIARSDAEVALLAAKATVAEARSRAADLAIARQRLADTTIRAPRLAGAVQYAVAARMVSVGEYVLAGAPLFRLVASDPIKFRGDVPERFAGQVQAGQLASLRIAAYEEPFAGVVARISPQVDARSRTFEVEVEVPNPRGRVKAGGFGRVSLVVAEDASVLLVPEEAPVVFAGVTKLFTVQDGAAKEHRVQLGRRVDGLVEVLSPPPGMERVVVAGGARLANGTPVRETTSAP